MRRVATGKLPQRLRNSVTRQCPGRAEPRAIKRRAKPHDLMNKPRDRLRKALKKQRKAA